MPLNTFLKTKHNQSNHKQQMIDTKPTALGRKITISDQNSRGFFFAFSGCGLLTILFLLLLMMFCDIFSLVSKYSRVQILKCLYLCAVYVVL